MIAVICGALDLNFYLFKVNIANFDLDPYHKVPRRTYRSSTSKRCVFSFFSKIFNLHQGRKQINLNLSNIYTREKQLNWKQRTVAYQNICTNACSNSIHGSIWVFFVEIVNNFSYIFRPSRIVEAIRLYNISKITLHLYRLLIIQYKKCMA
jgi:hypothetical protein